MKREGHPNQFSVAEAQRWVQGLQAMARQIGYHFARSEARELVAQYLVGLLSLVERKNG